MLPSSKWTNEFGRGGADNTGTVLARRGDGSLQSVVIRGWTTALQIYVRLV